MREGVGKREFPVRGDSDPERSRGGAPEGGSPMEQSSRAKRATMFLDSCQNICYNRDMPSSENSIRIFKPGCKIMQKNWYGKIGSKLNPL